MADLALVAFFAAVIVVCCWLERMGSSSAEPHLHVSASRADTFDASESLDAGEAEPDPVTEALMHELEIEGLANLAARARAGESGRRIIAWILGRSHSPP